MQPKETPPPSTTSTSSGPTPVMDVVTPPLPEKPDPAEAADKLTARKPSPQPAKEAPAKPVVPKQPASGVGMAIFATVVIVLGLAALAAYAYLKTR